MCSSYTGSFLGHKTGRRPLCIEKIEDGKFDALSFEVLKSRAFQRAPREDLGTRSSSYLFCWPKVFGSSKNGGVVQLPMTGRLYRWAGTGCTGLPSWCQLGAQGPVVPGCWPVVPPRSGCGTTGPTTVGTTGRGAHPL